MTIRYDRITNASGVVSVRNQQANLTLDPVEYAFLGNSTVRIKIRQDSIAGPVVLESQPITIVDNAELISVTANTYSVPEGQDVLFTILTRNAPDGAFIAYVAESVTGNITANDLTLGNVSAFAGGFSEIIDNIGTFIVFANVDSILGETGESFRISARAGNTNGLILGYSDNVTIKDSVEFFSITSSNSTVDFNTNVTFTIQTFGLPDGANLFYFTDGDVINFDSANAQANTGYVITSSNVATVTLRPIAPTNSISPFNLLIRDANTNALLASSSGVNSIGEDTIFNNITGGIETTIGNYKYHVFASSNTFTINRVGDIYSAVDIAVIGAGQPGQLFDGGRAGDVKDISYSMPQAIGGGAYNVPVTIGNPSQRATTVSFGPGSGGFSIIANDSNFRTGGQEPALSGGGRSGGGGAGARGDGGSATPFFVTLRSYGASGGAGYEVPWLMNGIGPQLGTGSIFGGGGGAGSKPAGQHPPETGNFGGSSSWGGGQGGSVYTELRFAGTPYYHFIATNGTPGTSYGSGGGGGSYGFNTIPTPEIDPRGATWPVPRVTNPGGSGQPGAVIMRYRIAED